MMMVQSGVAVNGMCELVAGDGGKEKVRAQGFDAIRPYGMSYLICETAELVTCRDLEMN